MSALIENLRHYQRLVLEAVRDAPDELFDRQLHPDLSPIGWHLGHCIFTESYWVRERLLEKEIMDSGLHALYQPALSEKRSRGERLPEKRVLLDWAAHCQQDNLRLLEKALADKTDGALMRNGFLPHFLIQHYCQHFETINIALSCQYLNSELQPGKGHRPVRARELSKDCCLVKEGVYSMGAEDRHYPYDNEWPRCQVRLDAYRIGLRPVNNGEYLQFMHENAYDRECYWSKQGWCWRVEQQIWHPSHWNQSPMGEWYGVDAAGAHPLAHTEPVSGISYYEAEAYASWANARLPHEHEWELACKKNLLQAVGKVWEWCANVFFPYQGFEPFPYAGYSQPYFDGKYRILKGGSRFTQGPIRRPSFRNYYQPDKRHQFAGLRLVFD